MEFICSSQETYKRDVQSCPLCRKPKPKGWSLRSQPLNRRTAGPEAARASPAACRAVELAVTPPVSVRKCRRLEPLVLGGWMRKPPKLSQSRWGWGTDSKRENLHTLISRINSPEHCNGYCVAGTVLGTEPVSFRLTL